VVDVKLTGGEGTGNVSELLPRKGALNGRGVVDVKVTEENELARTKRARII
jgi:hypothetical protein